MTNTQAVARKALRQKIFAHATSKWTVAGWEYVGCHCVRCEVLRTAISRLI